MQPGGARIGGEPTTDADPFLSQLSTAELEALEARGRRRRFPRGAVLFHEDDRSDWAGLVLRGRVKASYLTADGKEVVLAVRGPGEFVGEFSAIDGRPRSAAATALEPVEVLVVRVDRFREFLETHPRVAFVLLQTVTRKLRDSDRKRIEFTAHDSVGRVARRLVELAERFGTESGAGGVRIDLSITQEELAGCTASSREAASKALSTLRSRGWIETHRRSITILDLEALRRRAG